MSEQNLLGFERARKFYQPYIIARPEILEHLNLKAMGFDFADAQIINPLLRKNAAFVGLVHRLHSLVCGPFGMPMESWVQYDCSLIPGITFGFGHPTEALSPALRAGLEVEEDYSGLVPFSLGIAIPLPDRTNWEFFSLGSLNQVAAGAGPAGLNRLTLALGTAMLDLPELTAVLRWRSHLLTVFAGLGPLRLVTAWTPAHDYPDTITILVQVDDEARERLLRGVEVIEKMVDEYIDADDTDAMQRLQQQIETGAEIYILGPPHDQGTRLMVPIKKSSSVPTHGVRIEEHAELGGQS